MQRTSLEDKKKAVAAYSDPKRPLLKIAKLKRSNSAPDYKSESLKSRSKATAKSRTSRYGHVIRVLTSDET